MFLFSFSYLAVRPIRITPTIRREYYLAVKLFIHMFVCLLMKTIRFDRDYLIVLNRGLDFCLKTNLAVRFVLLKKTYKELFPKKVAYPCSSCKTGEPVDLIK